MYFDRFTYNFAIFAIVRRSWANLKDMFWARSEDAHFNIVHLGLTLRVCLAICGSLRDKVGTYLLKQYK